jgi:hypothetical protein
MAAYHCKLGCLHTAYAVYYSKNKSRTVYSQSTLVSPAYCIKEVYAISVTCVFRVGQNHIYTVYIRYFWQGNHQ